MEYRFDAEPMLTAIALEKSVEVFEVLRKYYRDSTANRLIEEALELCQSALARGEENGGADKKQCTKCRKIKPLDDFTNNKKSKDGKAYKCRACKAAYMREYGKTESGKAARKRAGVKWRNTKSGREKENENSRKYYAKNKDKFAKWWQEYYAEHKEEISEWHREYYQTEHGKAVVDAAHLRRRLNPGSDKPDTDTLLEIWAEFDGICPYCGREIVDGHIDHIIPISKGGTNDRENLVYVCAECNLRKHDRSLEEFFAYMDKVEIEYDNSRLLEKFPEIQT